MALINISDKTRDTINELVLKTRKSNPELKITQDTIISIALKKFVEAELWKKQ